MSRKAFTLLFMMFSTIAFSSIAGSAQALTAETMDFRFRGFAAGQCYIAYGGTGPGFPNPLDWSGLGNGQATATGYASDATETFPTSIPDVYISENIRAIGEITIGWTEGDGSKHRIIAGIYSTATSEALFYPSNNQFVLTIPMYSPPDKCMRFNGIYVSSSKIARISGIALFAVGIYGPNPWPDNIIVLLGDEQSGTLFFIAWSRLGTPTPSPLGFLPAAKAYASFVKKA
jgi:hypothetical protein